VSGLGISSTCFKCEECGKDYYCHPDDWRGYCRLCGYKVNKRISIRSSGLILFILLALLGVRLLYFYQFGILTRTIVLLGLIVPSFFL
jgi:hypothetical protein